MILSSCAAILIYYIRVSGYQQVKHKKLYRYMKICGFHCQRPLKNVPFCSIYVSGSNFNPRNTQCISVVKIIAFPRSKSGICDLILGKIEHFSKASVRGIMKARPGATLAKLWLQKHRSSLVMQLRLIYILRYGFQNVL